MVAQDHMFDQHPQLLRKRLELSNLFHQHPLRYADVPDHLPLQRVRERVLPAQLPYLPNVMQNRPRHQQLPVHLRIKRSRRPAHPHQRQHMLEQPTQPRMVQHLRRRSRLERRPDRRIIQKRKQQPLQIRIRKPAHIPAQLRPHCFDVEYCRR